MSSDVPGRLRRMIESEGPAIGRLEVAAVVGVATSGIVLAIGAPWPLTVLAGWNSAALVFLVAVWATVLRFDGPRTAAMATREDPRRGISDSVLLLASSASLVGVVFGLYRANRVHGGLRVIFIATVIGGVVCSWTVVHTVYTLRYAHLHYRTPVGGIAFPGTPEPDYWDFAYVAFTLGMTFQVSDTNIESRAIRHAALVHCLLSYLFGTAVIATSINILAGLV